MRPALLAPKGRNTIAQGNALGREAAWDSGARKGRDNLRRGQGRISPLQGEPACFRPLPQGVALGYRISPLQGERASFRPFPQGVALGYRISPLQGEPACFRPLPQGVALGYHISPLQGEPASFRPLPQGVALGCRISPLQGILQLRSSAFICGSFPPTVFLSLRPSTAHRRTART